MTDRRVVFVTGAAGGIGRALVDRLLAAGDRVVATDLAPPHRPDADPDRHLALALDVTDADAWRRALAAAEERFGPIDALVNNAGYLRPGVFHEAPLEEIDRHLDVNARGTMIGTRLAVGPMIERRRGQIVNLGSLAAIAPVTGLDLYAASKFAVRGFSLAAAQSLAGFGVAVTLVCPDAVATPMYDLQVDCDATALTFSGPGPLAPEAVAGAIVEVALVRRPIELVLPLTRGALARLVGAVPRLVWPLGRLLGRKGRRAQARVRASRSQGSDR